MEKKYELTDEIIEYNGRTLHRIKALKDFSDVKKENLGGWIEKEDNLSQEGDCWIYGNAEVHGDDRISGNACVYDNSIICDNTISGNSIICDDASVYGNTILPNNAYITIGPIGSREGYTTFYLDKDNNILVSCGCFNDTIDRFKEEVIKVHKDNKYGKQYLSIIDSIKNILGE